MSARRHALQRGVALMGLMVLLALGGLAAVRYGALAIDERQREREAQLLWVGQQYRDALASYYHATPSPIKHLPVKLDELVHDTRFPQPVRHLRQLYPDPTQPEVPFAVLRHGIQIIGVYSQSDAAVQRRHGFAPGLESFEGSRRYSDWRFVFLPRPTTPATGGATAPPKRINDRQLRSTP